MKRGSTKGSDWVMRTAAIFFFGSNQQCVFKTPAQNCEPAERIPGTSSSIRMNAMLWVFLRPERDLDAARFCTRPGRVSATHRLEDAALGRGRAAGRRGRGIGSCVTHPARDARMETPNAIPVI
jgi:hypothetical protein